MDENARGPGLEERMDAWPFPYFTVNVPRFGHETI
jgi:hypothetical protein